MQQRRRPTLNIESPLLRVREAALLASTSERTVNAWLARGLLRRVRLPGLKRSVRIDRQELLDLIHSGNGNGQAA